MITQLVANAKLMLAGINDAAAGVRAAYRIYTMLKNYSVKKNLIENPKTPILIATRLVQHLREADLRQLTKSKNITGPVKDAARRHLERRSR